MSTIANRILFQHRQELGDGFEFTAEAGIISDRNFLQEYFNTEWNELKDQSTDIELRWHQDAISASVMAGLRTDDFFTETQWLPKGDLNILGESLAADRLTFFDHTSLGYAQFKTASLPSAAAGDEAVSHLPWEANNRQGGRFATRNELDSACRVGSA